jgi:hypothetical protein
LMNSLRNIMKYPKSFIVISKTKKVIKNILIQANVFLVLLKA